MTEPSHDILTNPVSWIFLVFVLALAVVPLWVGGRMLNGTVRSWTLAPKIPFQIPNRNTWPFILVCFGLAIAIAILSIPFEVAGWEDGRQFIWNGPFWIPWVGVALGVFYWPLALTPAWYRRWVNHDDYPDVSPWRPEEVSAVMARPADQRRDRMVRDMGRCDIDVKAAWSEAGLTGEPPEEWWEKSNRQGAQRYAEMGITEDMDTLQRAEIIREHRQKAKAARKAGRQAPKGHQD